MENYFIALLYILGGLLPVFFWTLIKITKNRSEYKNKKNALDDIIHQHPNIQNSIGGNLDLYISQNPEKFKKINFWDELFLNLSQPLYILSLLALLQFRSVSIIIFTIVMTFFAFAIEFYYAEEWHKKAWYRLLIIIFWVIFLGIIIISTIEHSSILNIDLNNPKK